MLEAIFCHMGGAQLELKPEGPPGHTKMKKSALHHYQVFRRHLNIDFQAPDPHIELQMSIQDAFFSISDFI